jgi:hypothetical protein
MPLVKKLGYVRSVGLVMGNGIINISTHNFNQSSHRNYRVLKVKNYKFVVVTYSITPIHNLLIFVQFFSRNEICMNVYYCEEVRLGYVGSGMCMRR